MGDPNFQYFALDEDSEVEEFVAEDPNIRRRVFWYNLLETTLKGTSRTQSIIQALIWALGLFLQVKLLLVYSANQEWKFFSWTISALLFAGGVNLISLHSRRNHDTSESTRNSRLHHPKQHQKIKLNSVKLDKFVQVLRLISFYLMISPIFNVFYYWIQDSKYENDLKRPLIMRNQPQPTKHEITTMKEIWSKYLKKYQLGLNETMLKFFTLSLLQVFIFVCYEDNLEADTKAIQMYIIIWGVLCLALTCTNYANAHFNYTKVLQFEDLKENDINMLFIRVTFVNSVFCFLHNLTSITFRLYCLAVLLDTIHYWSLIFIVIIYFTFTGLVSAMPTRSRLRYENPPVGLPTKWSDSISRWFNLFCSHNVKQECFIHFTYLFICIYAIPRIIYLYMNWSLETDFQQEFNNVEIHDADYFEELKQNVTRFQYALECVQELQESHTLKVPVISTFIQHFIHLIVLITYNCSEHFHQLQTDFTAALLLILHCLLSFLYLGKLKNQVLFENEFPAQEAYKYWIKWLTRDWVINDTYEVKKIILCLISSDKEIASIRTMTQQMRNDGKINASWKCIFRSLFCCVPCYQRKITAVDDVVNSKSKLHILISSIWDKNVQKTSHLNSNDDGSTKLYQLLEKRRLLMAGLRQNTPSNLICARYGCDAQVNNFLELLLENFVLEDDVIRLLILFIEKFDEYLINTSNSFRLANIDKILSINSK